MDHGFEDVEVMLGRGEVSKGFGQLAEPCTPVWGGSLAIEGTQTSLITIAIDRMR